MRRVTAILLQEKNFVPNVIYCLYRPKNIGPKGSRGRPKGQRAQGAGPRAKGLKGPAQGPRAQGAGPRAKGSRDRPKGQRDIHVKKLTW